MAENRILPPKMSTMSFEDWEKEIELWQIITNIPIEKQGAYIFLSLEGKARECCRTIDKKDLTGKEGVGTLLKKLKELYAQDEKQLAYQAYEDFEKFIRKDDMNVTDFINEWERKYNICKAKKMILPEGVLAYRLLKSANLSSERQTLVRATIGELNLEDMKKQIKAIFDNLESKTSEIETKIENTLHVQDEEEEESYNEVLYSDSFRGPGSRGRGRGMQRGFYRGDFRNRNDRGNRGSYQNYRGSYNFYNNYNNYRGSNNNHGNEMRYPENFNSNNRSFRGRGARGQNGNGKYYL